MRPKRLTKTNRELILNAIRDWNAHSARDPRFQKLFRSKPKEVSRYISSRLGKTGTTRSAHTALTDLARKSPKVFYKPHSTVRVGAKLVKGDRSALEPLVKARIVLPMAKEGERWRVVSLDKATHFMTPTRMPTITPFFKETHGRSVFAEQKDRTYFFKGAGLDQYVSFTYRDSPLRSARFLGGNTREMAEHEMHIANKFLQAYNRLLRRKSKAVQLARRYGATFFPGTTDPVVLKVEQVPTLTTCLSKLSDFGEKERKAIRMLKSRPSELAAFPSNILKTRAKKKVIPEVPREVLRNQVQLIYSVKTPFRLQDIHNISIERILPLYGMRIRGEDIYYRGKKIGKAEALRIASEGFTARQALSYVIAREAKALTRSKGGNDTMSIFSEHNTTVAGENVDYDTVTIKRHLVHQSEEGKLIKKHIEMFLLVMANKLGCTYPSTEYPIIHFKEVFDRIVAVYSNECAEYSHDI